VRPALVQRQAALAAAALLASLGVLALPSRGDEGSAPLVLRGGLGPTWETAVVGELPLEAYASETSCGSRLDSGTVGVAHPVLPCGVDLVLELRGTRVRTEVVEHAPVEGGHEFDVTQALAERLGLRGTETIRWRFAG
jgi:hypothetical protein